MGRLLSAAQGHSHHPPASLCSLQPGSVLEFPHGIPVGLGMRSREKERVGEVHGKGAEELSSMPQLPLSFDNTYFLLNPSDR